MRIIRKPILVLSEKEKNEIDYFIEENNGLIFHETKFNEIVSKSFGSKLSYLLAYKGQKLIGICPIHSLKKGLLINSYSNNGSFEIPYGGWVFNANITNFHYLWDSLKLKINESLTYWSSFLCDHSLNDLRISQKFLTGIIYLGQSEDYLFNNIVSSKRRNMIRKGIRSGVIVKKFGIDGLELFYSMKANVFKKLGIRESRFNYYQKILASYYNKNKAIIMIAYHEDKPLSGIFLIGNKNVIHYWQGASIMDVQNLGQGELLQWEAIMWAKNQGVKYYDLCVIEPERLPNIAQFKMGFTKELIPFYCINKKSFFFRVINRIQNVLIN